MYKVVCKYSFGHEKCAEELLVDFFSKGKSYYLVLVL